MDHGVYMIIFVQCLVFRCYHKPIQSHPILDNAVKTLPVLSNPISFYLIYNHGHIQSLPGHAAPDIVELTALLSSPHSATDYFYSDLPIYTTSVQFVYTDFFEVPCR